MVDLMIPSIGSIIGAPTFLWRDKAMINYIGGDALDSLIKGLSMSVKSSPFYHTAHP